MPTSSQNKDEAPKEGLVIHLLETNYPKGWKAPRLVTYNGIDDLDYHPHMFVATMEDMTKRKDIWCHRFHHTLIEDFIWCY